MWLHLSSTAFIQKMLSKQTNLKITPPIFQVYKEQSNCMGESSKEAKLLEDRRCRDATREIL